jgi:hypothetical protein
MMAWNAPTMIISIEANTTQPTQPVCWLCGAGAAGCGGVMLSCLPFACSGTWAVLAVGACGVSVMSCLLT